MSQHSLHHRIPLNPNPKSSDQLLDLKPAHTSLVTLQTPSLILNNLKIPSRSVPLFLYESKLRSKLQMDVQII